MKMGYVEAEAQSGHEALVSSTRLAGRTIKACYADGLISQVRGLHVDDYYRKVAGLSEKEECSSGGARIGLEVILNSKICIVRGRCTLYLTPLGESYTQEIPLSN